MITTIVGAGEAFAATIARHARDLNPLHNGRSLDIAMLSKHCSIISISFQLCRAIEEGCLVTDRQLGMDSRTFQRCHTQMTSVRLKVESPCYRLQGRRP